MTKKNMLWVKTAGWSDTDKKSITPHLKKYRWQATVLTKDGKKTYCYFNTKFDLELASTQMGFKILKVTKI